MFLVVVVLGGVHLSIHVQQCLKGSNLKQVGNEEAEERSDVECLQLSLLRQTKNVAPRPHACGITCRMHRIAQHLWKNPPTYEEIGQ